MKRKVNVIEDLDGKKTVFIHDILFKGKRAMKWDEVEKYLRQYVGGPLFSPKIVFNMLQAFDTIVFGSIFGEKRRSKKNNLTPCKDVIGNRRNISDIVVTV